MGLFRRFLSTSAKASYSQCGEDLIVAFLLETIGIRHPTYLDIGAFDPVNLSNTYLFYKKGGRGGVSSQIPPSSPGSGGSGVGMCV